MELEDDGDPSCSLCSLDDSQGFGKKRLNEVEIRGKIETIQISFVMIGENNHLILARRPELVIIKKKNELSV